MASLTSVAYLTSPPIRSKPVFSPYTTPRELLPGLEIPAAAGRKRTLEEALSPSTLGCGKDNATPTPFLKKQKVVNTSVSVWNLAPFSHCA
jgi:hypothetical protein